jgi:hypothetical protein
MTGQGEEIHKKQHLELVQGHPMRSLRTLMGLSNRLVIYRYGVSRFRFANADIAEFEWILLVPLGHLFHF